MRGLANFHVEPWRCRAQTLTLLPDMEILMSPPNLVNNCPHQWNLHIVRQNQYAFSPKLLWWDSVRQLLGGGIVPVHVLISSGCCWYISSTIKYATTRWRSISQLTLKSLSSSPNGFIRDAATLSHPLWKKNCSREKNGTYKSMSCLGIIWSGSRYCHSMSMPRKKVCTANITTWVYPSRMLIQSYPRSKSTTKQPNLTISSKIDLTVESSLISPSFLALETMDPAHTSGRKSCPWRAAEWRVLTHQMLVVRGTGSTSMSPRYGRRSQAQMPLGSSLSTAGRTPKSARIPSSGPQWAGTCTCRYRSHTACSTAAGLPHHLVHAPPPSE